MTTTAATAARHRFAQFAPDQYTREYFDAVSERVGRDLWVGPTDQTLVIATTKLDRLVRDAMGLADGHCVLTAIDVLVNFDRNPAEIVESYEEIARNAREYAQCNGLCMGCLTRGCNDPACSAGLIAVSVTGFDSWIAMHERSGAPADSRFDQLVDELVAISTEDADCNHCGRPVTDPPAPSDVAQCPVCNREW